VSQPDGSLLEYWVRGVDLLLNAWEGEIDAPGWLMEVGEKTAASKKRSP